MAGTPQTLSPRAFVDGFAASLALSTYSIERMREERFVEQVTLSPDTTIASVMKVDDG